MSGTGKAVLIVTPYFAPQSHAAVFRTYKLAKYLPRLGWRVFVLTVDINYHFPEDDRLLADLPAEVVIKRVRYVEPTLRGVRMALGGRDRTFSTQMAQGVVTKRTESGGDPPSVAVRLYNDLLARRLHIPDAYWTWKRAAVREALRLIDEQAIGTVLTSSGPYTTFVIGAELKRLRPGLLRWVADIRDPMTYEHRLHSPDEAVLTRQRRIEKRALQEADAVTFAMSAGPLILTDQYGPEFSKKLHFIPSGLDGELVETPGPAANPPAEAPYVLFVGEYLEGYGGDFFEIFARAIRDPLLSGKGLKLVLVGRKEINERTAGSHIKRLGLGERVEFRPYVPQREVYSMIQRAEAVVLCTSPHYGWWVLHAKLVDYLALRKPVLARVPDPSEARKWLAASGLGIFLDGPIDKAAAQMATALSKGPGCGVVAVEEVCRRFEVSAQARDFSALFERLPREGKHGEGG